MQLSPEDRKSENGGLVQASNDIQEDSGGVSDVEQVSQREIIPPNMSGPQTASTISSRKRRRVQTNATIPSSLTPSGNRSVQGREKTPIVKNEELQEALKDGVRFTALYVRDVLKGAIKKMEKPLSWFLAILICAWMLSFMTPVVRTAFSPLCVIPGISKSTLCLPTKPAPSVDFGQLFNIQGSTFEQLVGESAAGSQLSINVLRAEMATQDLSLVVRYSDLRSKDDIADMLRTIALDAKKTGRGLSKLDAKVIGAIDEVMALNNYAMAIIDGAHNKAPSWLLQAVSPIKLGPTAGEIIVEAYTLAMDESEKTIQKLILEAEVSGQNLEQLDADVSALHEVISRENIHTTTEKDKLLGELWTKLGGNRKAVRDYSDRLALLNNLGKYRRQAAAYVKATLRALHAMSDDLEVLRERMATLSLVGSKVPIEVHMESIQSGLERLQESRMKSRGRGIGDETVRLLLNDGAN